MIKKWVTLLYSSFALMDEHDDVLRQIIGRHIEYELTDRGHAYEAVYVTGWDWLTPEGGAARLRATADVVI